jgi:predicted transcriptional regulator
MSVRTTARRVRRDAKAAHGEVRARLAAPLVDRTADGSWSRPTAP